MGLRDLFKAIKSRARIIIVTTVIVTLVALVASLLTPKTYEGKATVLLTQQNTGAALLGAPEQYKTEMALQRDVQTQISVMKSPVVLDGVVEKLGLDISANELARHVTIKFDGETNIVTIIVETESPATAAAWANTIAESYVAWSQEQQRKSIRAAAADVEKRLVATEEQIAALQQRVSNGNTSGDTRAQLQAANSLYSTLSDKLETLKINEQLSTGAGSVLTTATPSSNPVAPKPVRNTLLAAILGLALGIGIALVIETLDNTIKSEEQAKEMYGAPVLCSIPNEDKRKKGGPEYLALKDNPGGPAAEAYRILRNNLGFINFEHDIKTVLVTSALPSEGKSTVAANLASVLAQAGKKVVLVSCDFHQPGSARFFGVSTTFGLSDVLRGAMTIDDVLQASKEQPGVLVVAPGPTPPNPSELLGSATMERLLANLRDRFDWVILDSAPLLVVADAAAVARWVDGVLMVTHANTSTIDAARKSREQLDYVGARTLGVVLWGIEDVTVRGGYSGYGAYRSRDER